MKRKCCQCYTFYRKPSLVLLVESIITQSLIILQGSSMSSADSVKNEVFHQISQLLENKSLTVTDDMALIGGDSVLDSMKLVELCLALEDKAADMGFEFDWTSDAAMSRSRSMFRTAGSLATEFISQMEAKK